MRGHDLLLHVKTWLGHMLQTFLHPGRPILRRTVAALALGLLLAGCRQLESIPYTPPQTPESWLTIQPHVELVILSRTAGSGSAHDHRPGLRAWFARHRPGRVPAAHPQRTALPIGVGRGADPVGRWRPARRHELRGVQLLHQRCAGRAACLWTSGWEIGYLLLSVASVDAIVLAQAYGCAVGRARRRLARYAVANLALYAVALLVGTLIPIRFLISFEFRLVATAPSIVLVILHNTWRYRRLKRRLYSRKSS